MPKLTLILIALFIANISVSQEKDTIVIKGVITEMDSITAVPFASVFIHKTTIGVTSNENGHFELKLPKKLLNDTLIVSSIGYSKYSGKISNFKNLKKIKILLNDSIFLLDEVVAIPYDYFETLEWASKNKKQKAKYLTFATEELENISNFIKVLNSEFGKPNVDDETYQWKHANIPILEKQSKILLRYFSCPYCVEKSDFSVTLIIKDSKGEYPLNDKEKEELLENYFQGILDKTFKMGVDFTNLEQVNDLYYKKGYSETYTGKCFAYFKNGQIGLKGAFINGKKHGKWEYWYSNSQNKMLVNFNNGIKTGTWTFWYENGVVRIDNHYINDKLDGKNFWWYSNGKKKKAAYYENGKFISKIEWDEKGKVIDSFGKYIE